MRYEIELILNKPKPWAEVEWERRIFIVLNWDNGYNDATVFLMKQQKTGFGSVVKEVK